MNNAVKPVESTDYLGPANHTWAIFLISVLGLFLEMLLIRWIGTEIRIFAYLQNTIASPRKNLATKGMVSSKSTKKIHFEGNLCYYGCQKIIWPKH